MLIVLAVLSKKIILIRFWVEVYLRFNFGMYNSAKNQKFII